MKHILYQPLALCILMGMTACGNDYSEPKMDEAVLINEINVSTGDALILAKGMSVTPVYTVVPEDAMNRELTFSSSAPETASVDATGSITANELGQAYINITPLLTFDVMKSITVSVVPAATAIEAHDFELYAGTTADLSLPEYVTVTPAGAYNVFDAVSSNEQVAKFQDGKIIAVQAGTATVTVRSKDGSDLEASAKVTVLPSIPVESFTFKGNQEFANKETGMLDFTVVPANATIQILDWSSSDPSVAEVDNSGMVTARNFGTTTIVVRDPDGKMLASTEIAVVAGKIDVSGANLEAFFGLPTNNKNTTTTINENGLLHVVTESGRCDFNLNGGKLAFNADTYPIMACKISGTVTQLGTEYFGLDLRTSLNSSNVWNNGCANGVEPGECHFLTDDGNHVFFFDLTKHGGGVYKGKGAIESTGFYFKIGYNNSIREYDVYWFKSFRSVAELREYIENEKQ